jgi:hypothetical protein
MSELRRYYSDPSSRLSKEDAKHKKHYKLDFDDLGRIISNEKYLPGFDFVSRVDYEYSLEEHTDIITKKFFDESGQYNGKMRTLFTPPDTEMVETYDSDDNLVDLIEGLYTYRIQDGKPTKNFKK